jgi:hypothetical protein
MTAEGKELGGNPNARALTRGYAACEREQERA